VRRILLPIALACAVSGLVTASTIVHTSSPGAVEQMYVAEPTPVDTPELALAAAPPSTTASQTPAVVTTLSAPPVTHTPVTTAPPAAKPAAKKQEAAGSPAGDMLARDVGTQLPLPYSGPAGQVITVVAPTRTSTTATLTAWTKQGVVWHPDIGPVTANIGSDGVGAASETTSRTPAGVFGLTEAFGIAGNNGTRLPYFQVDNSDWWVSDVTSPAYNTHTRCAPGTCPFNERAGEHLLAAGSVYNHAVVINYNRGPITPGAGSAFFLHISNGRPTAGCVSVPSDQLDAIMRWLDPAQQPVINIG
jgi:L,D-peptidoglycan transpeptidase YkuD (ErfK/YbiS/YcfS/YnhG family)